MTSNIRLTSLARAVYQLERDTATRQKMRAMLSVLIPDITAMNFELLEIPAATPVHIKCRTAKGYSGVIAEPAEFVMELALHVPAGLYHLRNPTKLAVVLPALYTIAHEAAHIHQHLTGRLVVDQDRLYWDNEFVGAKKDLDALPENEYNALPHERAANIQGLANMRLILQRLNIATPSTDAVLDIWEQSAK